MPRFKPLSLGRLPRVFVNILAMDRHDFEIMAYEITKMTETTTFLGYCLVARDPAAPGPQLDSEVYDSRIRQDIGKLFKAILELPKAEREKFVKPFDRKLNELMQNDFFGTEGQSDPRGDHRD
jgi:hypothetical protein